MSVRALSFLYEVSDVANIWAKVGRMLKKAAKRERSSESSLVGSRATAEAERAEVEMSAISPNQG